MRAHSRDENRGCMRPCKSTVIVINTLHPLASHNRLIVNEIFIYFARYYLSETMFSHMPRFFELLFTKFVEYFVAED